MFFLLPEDIIRYIYEFDKTYRDIFNEIVKEIKYIQIYQYKNLFYIYDKEEEILYLTDSLKIPSWISTSYMIPLSYFKNIIEKKRLTRINDKLEFDIKNYLFEDESELHSI